MHGLKQFDLTGMSVGLTGGGGHLGSAMARALAGAGAQVIICGRTAATLERVAEQAARDGGPGRVVPFPADLASTADVERFLDAWQGLAQGPLGFVNNAYSGGPSQLLGHLEREAIMATVQGALADLMLATDSVARRMEGRGGGAIVNVSSMYGMVSPDPRAYEQTPAFHNPPAYGAAKAGVEQFTRYAACHLAPRGIRVNCLTPGPFPGAAVQESKPFIDQLNRRVPLGRVGRPEELTGAVIFLLSAASSFVTGHNLVVDGGWTAW